MGREWVDAFRELSAFLITDGTVTYIFHLPEKKVLPPRPILYSKPWYVHFKVWYVHFKLWYIHFKLWYIHFKP